jgi:hypothetical protein
MWIRVRPFHVVRNDMSYEDVDEIKKKLHDAYMTACDIAGGNTIFFLPIQVVAFESGDKKFSVMVELKEE